MIRILENCINSSIHEHTWLELPRGARIISAAWRMTNICIYAMVDSKIEELENHYFVTRPNGPVELDMEVWEYVTTVVGSYSVLHIFHSTNKPL